MNRATRNTLFVMVVLATLAVGWYVIVGRSKDADEIKDEIKIGFAGALSGPASSIGVEIKRGAELAIEVINAQGGVRGRMLELITRDDEHEPRKTVASYHELVEQQGVVAMLGATNSAAMLAVTPLVNDTLKVPVICPATDASAITANDAGKQGRDNYLFRVGMYGEGQANFMVDSVVKRLGHTRVALLTWTGGWGVTGRGELIRRLKELGLTPVADETYTDSDTDMTPQLLKIKAANAQSILNYGLVRENVFVVKSKQSLNDQTPYVSAWVLAGPAFWKAAGTAAEGVLASTTVTIDGPLTPAQQHFVDIYRARYKEEMLNPVFALGAYDAVFLLKAAIERRGAEPAQIRTALEELPEFTGLVKQFSRPVFTRERHNALTEEDMLLTRWTDGKLLQLQFDGVGPYIQTANGTKRYMDTATGLLK